MVDQFFTPANIASSSFAHFDKENIEIVADFSIGDGALIDGLPFKPKTVIGLDIDKKVVGNIKKKNPDWNLEVGNFLNPNNRTQIWLANWSNLADLIVLNPPFSCRGGKRFEVQIQNYTLMCRTALAFIVKALSFLKPNGVLIAIVPLSLLKSQSDLKILNFLKINWHIEFGTVFGRNTFQGCYPNSTIVEFRKRNNLWIEPITKIDNFDVTNFKVEIIRGSTQIHRTLDCGPYKVIHTTNLKGGKLDLTNLKYSNTQKKYVTGTFLFIPRVGLPNFKKIIIVESKDVLLLSDCLYAVKGITLNETLEVKNIIEKKWEVFSSLYQSTCAPYITLEQLKNFFAENSITMSIVDTFS